MAGKGNSPYVEVVITSNKHLQRGMTMKRMLPAFIWALAPPAYAQSAPAQRCAHPLTGDAAEVRAHLANRAAEIFERASASGWGEDKLLRAFVDPNAQVTLITGDVVASPSGLGGVRALAEHIKADTYRYPLPKGYADGPLDVCRQTLKLELIDSANRRRLITNLRFQDDVLVSVRAEFEAFAEARLKPRD